MREPTPTSNTIGVVFGTDTLLGPWGLASFLTQTKLFAKFCYDRIHDVNLATNFVWVRKGSNPYGPKRKWVPKTTSIVFDVGVALT